MTDTNIVAAAVLLTFTAFPLVVMNAENIQIGDTQRSFGMFLLSVYVIAKTLVAQYVVLPLKSWTGSVGASDQSVALFTGTGQNLIGSSLSNFAVANTYEETKFWFVRQAGVKIGALFKPEQMKLPQVYKYNPTPQANPQPTPAPTINVTPTPSPTTTPTAGPTIGKDLFNDGKDIASGALALPGLQTQIVFGLASVAGTVYLIHQNSKKRERS